MKQRRVHRQQLLLGSIGLDPPPQLMEAQAACADQRQRPIGYCRENDRTRHVALLDEVHHKRRRVQREFREIVDATEDAMGMDGRLGHGCD